MKKKWSAPDIREIFVENSVVKGIERMEKSEINKLKNVQYAIEKKLKEIRK